MSDQVKKISQCRLCGSKNLTSVLNLGRQALTGVFPKTSDTRITTGPLELVLCGGCSLLQLNHSYDLKKMYGMNYGYRSGLNPSMVRHIEQKTAFLERLRPLKQGDIVLDIGSNDATLLKSYRAQGISRIGIDPTGIKFKDFYPEEIHLVPDFFSQSNFRKVSPDRNAAMVTSIAMFYDLESPKDFVEDVASILDTKGIWHFEQSYMPAMLSMNAYDTVCHEHLEYYSLTVVKSLLEDCGMRIIDVGMNDVNGGSFCVTAARKESPYPSNDPLIDWFLKQEDRMHLDTPTPYRRFEEKVFQHRKDLHSILNHFKDTGKKVIGYGASTKGNVMLQFCDITTEELPFIAEVNPGKFGAFTPGTNIPIISEDEAKKMKPDYLLVLPWHFRSGIIQKEQEFIQTGGKLIFPLPHIQIL